MTEPDREQKLLAFFSIDVAHGTAFKARHAASRDGAEIRRATWPVYFAQIFGRTLSTFRKHLTEAEPGSGARLGSMPRLWKFNGDELLFRELLLPSDESNERLGQVVDAFVRTIVQVDREFLPLGTGVRGCAWTAGFPIRNKELRTPGFGAIPVLRPTGYGVGGRPDFDTGLDDSEYAEHIVDFIGPDMDLGFRLSELAPPGRVCLSLDLAYLVSRCAQTHGTRLFHVGWKSLKGIADGRPYPIIYADTEKQLKERYLWERDDPDFQQAQGKRPLDPREVQELAEELWRQLPEFFIKPYIAYEEMNPDHERYWTSFDLERELGAVTLDPWAN